MNKKHNRLNCSVANISFRRFPSILLIFSFTLLLLTGCSGFYTANSVADNTKSDIDPRLAGMWQSIYERSKWDWAIQFSSEDHVSGSLSLFRSYDDYSNTPQKAPANVFSIRCIRKDNKGVCSAKLDGTPVPTVKEDMRGWLTLDVGDTWTISPEARYVIACYEIKENGQIALYANANLKVLKQYIAEKGLASNEDKLFVVTEPAPKLTKMLDTARTFFYPKATAILTKVVQETTEAKVARLIGQLSEGSPKRRYDAALQLGQFGEQAADAVPVLTKMIWDAMTATDNATLKNAEASAVALGQIGVSSPETLRALKYLSEETDDSQLKNATKTAFEKLQTAVESEESDMKVKQNEKVSK